VKPPVVIMAGGRGTRMGRITDVCPKPLLPVRGKPLAERIVDQLADAGVHDVVLSTHYMAQEFHEQFGDGSDRGLRMRYIEEPRPSGASAALDYIRGWKMGPVVLMNGDIDTDLDFADLLEFHDDSAADMTTVAVNYQIQVPYGVVSKERGHITEKPSIDMLINAGVYVLSRVALLASREVDNMVDLHNHVGEIGRSRIYVHDGRWADIGSPESYQEAQEVQSDERLADYL
jgi:NDP-sugar pyrophosphorylase family protein